MTTKIVNIVIPCDKNVPDILNTFSPEENYLLLKIGCDAMNEGKKAAINLSNEEIVKKVEKDFKKAIEDVNREKETDKLVNVKLQEKMAKMYELQIEQLNKKLENALNQIENMKHTNNDASLQEAIEREREKIEVRYREKEKQVERMTDVHEKLIVCLNQTNNNKTAVDKGKEGEKQFEDLATDTFLDFKGFNITDKHTQGGEGDFHLNFEEFDVLVDAKNYRKKVPNDQREKIKKDLLKNEHLHFAWLVSLNTSIEKYDKAPIMYEWISTKQCIVYINHLSSFEDPRKILRIVWFTCRELYNMTKEVYFDEEELNQLKDERFKWMDKMKGFRKRIREINTSMNATRNLIQLMDDELRDMMNCETVNMVDSNFSLFDDWWSENIEVTKDDTCLISTDLWLKFKQDNKDLIKEFEINTEKFKQYIKLKVPPSSITNKNKNSNSAFEIRGIELKAGEKVEKTIEKKEFEEKIELELNEECMNKKKRIVKKVK